MLKKQLTLILGITLVAFSYAQPLKPEDHYYAYGKKASNEGRYPDAINAFKKVVSLDKHYDSAYIEWSTVYAKMNKPDSAILILKLALKVNPKMYTAYLAMGKIYRDYKSNYDSALISYSNVLKMDSSNKEVYYSMAWCYNSKKEYDSAISFAIKAIAFDYNYKPPYSELAHAYHATKRYAEAIEQFKKYIAVSTCDLPLFYSGMCYMELNQFDNVQKMIDALNKMNSKMGEGLKKRWDMKKNQKPAQ